MVYQKRFGLLSSPTKYIGLHRNHTKVNLIAWVIDAMAMVENGIHNAADKDRMCRLPIRMLSSATHQSSTVEELRSDHVLGQICRSGFATIRNDNQTLLLRVEALCKASPPFSGMYGQLGQKNCTYRLFFVFKE